MLAVAVVAAVMGAIIATSVTPTSGQAPAAAARVARVGGKPNLSGIWQANNEANWDLQAHAARPAAVTQQGYYPYDYARVPAAPVLALGAAGAVPGSLGVVQGDGQIPYKPEALAIKTENAEHWIDRDPEVKCYLPGIPRAMYMPYPFQITQSTNKRAPISQLGIVEPPRQGAHLDSMRGREPTDANETCLGSLYHGSRDDRMVDLGVG